MLLSALVVPSVTVSAEEVFILPDSVDNSTSPYFPEIGNQGSMGSCASWAHVYYSFTYAVNKSRGIKTTPENTFSPQWSYNLTSNGEGEGSTSADLEWFLEKQGGVTLSMVPYVEDPVNWCSDLNVWRESINNRLADTIKYKDIGSRYSSVTSPDDEDLLEVKTALANGEVLTFSTEIYSWVTTRLKTHKDAPENNKFEGEEAVKFVNGGEGSHAMTIVGYNDNIWVDINDNGKVESGEIGAFKVANSWGKGYHNDGFVWLAYDAVNAESSVAGFDGPERRNKATRGIESVVPRPYGDGTDVYIKYNFKAGNRRENHIIITAEKDGTEYTYKAFFPLLTLTSGEAKIPYDGNMLIALDNVIPDISAENFSDYNWSVTFVDKNKDECETVYRDAEIVIESTNQSFRPQNAYPITLNGESKTVEFAKTDLNHATVYYRGYSNPSLSYNLDGKWIENCPMESNTEREGYVYKLVIDLKDKASADIFFTDSKGNKDDNNGKKYTVTKGLNYFVTEGVAEPIEIDINLEFDKMERAYGHTYSADVKGGYAPYTYNYTFTNLDTNEQNTVKSINEDGSVYYIINNTGNYRLTVEITDFEGTTEEKSVDFEVIDSPFSFSDFDVETEGELFVGKPVDFRAITQFESIIRIGAGYEQYDVLVTKDGKVVYEELIKPVAVDHNKMTSTAEFSWTPTEAGHYGIKISGTDWAKEYAEKTVEFDVVNKAYVYYRGYYSPTLSYKTADGDFASIAMMPCEDEYGYPNMITVDLEDMKNTEVYFSDSNGNKDTNDGEYFTISAGKNYFVTFGAVPRIKAELKCESLTVESGSEVMLETSVTGGYEPYSYLYIIENTQTGEKTYTENSRDLAKLTHTFAEDGTYTVTVFVSDFTGDNTEAKAEINVVAPTEAPTTTTAEVTEPSEAETSTPDETTLPETSVTNPTEIICEVIGIIGDTNGDSKVNIKDATLIQKYIAKMDTEAEIIPEIADCDKDLKINIKDVTLIQKYLAKYDTRNVGEELVRYTVVTLPVPATSVAATVDEPQPTAEKVTTEAPTEATEAPVTTTLPTEPQTTVEPTTTEAPTEVITTTPTEPTTEEVSTAPVELPTLPEVRTVTFTNSHRWTGDIRCYYWGDANTAMTIWPGEVMKSAGVNDFGEDMYTFEVPEGATWIIFNNGTSFQTVDIPFEGEMRYYPLTTQNELGHYNVGTW